MFLVVFKIFNSTKHVLFNYKSIYPDLTPNIIYIFTIIKYGKFF